MELDYTYIKYNRSELARSLQTKPIANHLLSVIAQRIKYKDDPISGLKAGQCYMGDYSKLGTTRGQYRNGLKNLVEWQIITIHTTNKGTIVTLINSDVYDINNTIATNDTTIQQPTNNHPATIQQPLNKKDKKGKKDKKFVTPTQDEVYEYMYERGHYEKEEAGSFVDFYSSKGWMVGKNKMKDWKAAVRNWLKRSKDDDRRKAPTATDFISGRYSVRDAGADVSESLPERLERLRADSNNENVVQTVAQIPHIDN